MSILMNHPFHRGTYMYFTCIIMKFINEVVNKQNKIVKSEITIIFFVVMDLICVSKKKNVNFSGF